MSVASKLCGVRFSIPIGKFLGESPLTAIAQSSPVTEATGVGRLFGELDARPKW